MKILRKVKEDLFFGMPEDDFSQFGEYEVELKDASKALVRNGEGRFCRVRAVHMQRKANGMDLNLAEPDAGQREMVRQAVVGTIRLAQMAEVEKVVLHLGYANPYEQNTHECFLSALDTLKSAMKEAGVYAHDARPIVCIENDDMFGPEIALVHRFMRGPGAAMLALEYLDGNCGICIDMEHALRYGFRRDYQDESVSMFREGGATRLDRENKRRKNRKTDRIMKRIDRRITSDWERVPGVMRQRHALEAMLDESLNVRHMHICKTFWKNDIYTPGKSPSVGAHFPISYGEISPWFRDLLKYTINRACEIGCGTASLEFDERPGQYSHCAMSVADRILLESLMDNGRHEPLPMQYRQASGESPSAAQNL
jgi:hypothetical protein